MASVMIPSDMSVMGSLSVGGQLGIPSGSVTNASIAAGAAIDSEKVDHLYYIWTNFDLAKTGVPVARDELVFLSGGAYTVRAFKCFLWDTGTTTDIDFDLKKNGTTMLSAVVNFTNADADKLVKSGTLSGTSLVADDILSIDIAITTSTGAQGPFAVVAIEGPAF